MSGETGQAACQVIFRFRKIARGGECKQLFTLQLFSMPRRIIARGNRYGRWEGLSKVDYGIAKKNVTVGGALQRRPRVSLGAIKQNLSRSIYLF
jgi:hypothetical protein